MCEDRGIGIKKGSGRISRTRGEERVRNRRTFMLQRNTDPTSAREIYPLARGTPAATVQQPRIIQHPQPFSLSRIAESQIQRPLGTFQPVESNPMVQILQAESHPIDRVCPGRCCDGARERLRSRRAGLMDIALRTVRLMRINRELQKRLRVLQQETSDFIKSVIINTGQDAAVPPPSHLVVSPMPDNASASGQVEAISTPPNVTANNSDKENNVV